MVGINICRCRKVGVTKEGRYVQQRDILIDEDTCEGVSQVVEAYLSQIVSFNKVGKSLRYSVRS